MRLYSYFRSSASYRVRIALHWKGLKFDYIPIHLLKDGGQQNSLEYRKINPMGHVPALEDNGFLIAESMAIIQYLDDQFPQRRLFPAQARTKAQVLQICELVNSGIQPLQNLKVQKYLEQTCNLSKVESDGFVRHWIQDGLINLDKVLAQTAGKYCMADEVTAADCFVVPQCVTAGRFGIEINQYSALARAFKNATQLDAFVKAHPENQPDFQVQ